MAIQEYRKKANRGILLGIVGAIVGAVLTQDNPTPGIIVSLVFGIIFIWGCVNLAKSKGRSGLLGGILGLFGLIGLVILLILSDKAEGGGSPAVSPSG